MRGANFNCKEREIVTKEQSPLSITDLLFMHIFSCQQNWQKKKKVRVLEIVFIITLATRCRGRFHYRSRLGVRVLWYKGISR